MSSDDSSRESKGGVITSLRKLMGGGKAGEAPGPEGSGSGEDELILGGGVIPEVPPRRITGIGDDDGDDALVLVPTMREVAPDSVTGKEPDSDQASNTHGTDEAATAAEVIGEATADVAADVPDEAAGETADATPEQVADEPTSEHGAESGDEPGDEPAEEEPVSGDEGAGAEEAVAAAVDDQSLPPGEAPGEAQATPPAATATTGGEDDLAQADAPAPEDMAPEDMAPEDVASEDVATDDVAPEDVAPDDMAPEDVTAVDMAAVFSGLGVDEELDYGSDRWASAIRRHAEDDMADELAVPGVRDASEPGAPGAAAMPDPREMEDTIRRVIHEELTGEMGLRLSKNIERMIRDEIARALGQRD